MVKSGDHPCFSPDGRQVLYLHPWKGTIRAIAIDGSNDRVLFQAPDLTFAMMARWSSDGHHVAVLLLDLENRSDNRPTLGANASVTHPRIALVDLATGDSRVVNIRQQDGWDFYPYGHFEWK